MTIRAKEYIEKADVIVYDRLVSQEIIQLIPKQTRLIDVGKKSNKHPVPQDKINQILLEESQKGLLVVRLKGGDPFVFGRGGEELELLQENKIKFEVVPGITSAIAAPAYAGIPVTHRDFCSSIHIITGHQKENEPLNIDFKALVHTKGTLIFLMGVSSLREIVQGLLAAGMNENMPAAIVENGTRNNQRKVVASLGNLENAAKTDKIKSPAVIVVGQVCQLSEKYDWFSNRELHGLNIVVTRPKQSPGTLINKLQNLGANVYDCPCIDIETIEHNTLLNQSIENIHEYKWLVFTSRNGVNLFFQQLRNLNKDFRVFAHTKIAAVGTQTAQALSNFGIIADYIPEVFDGEHLVLGLLELLEPEEKILILRAAQGNEQIIDILNKHNKCFCDVPVYNTVYKTDNLEIIQQYLAHKNLLYVTFTSASTVEGFVKAHNNINTQKIFGICIGQQTAQAAKKYAIKHCIAQQASIDSMIEAIKEVYHAHKTTQA